jgi:hypothetical protein
MITLFLSHASEDQEYFVQPLAAALKSDFKVWYFEHELNVGDPLLKRIGEGLRACDYGIVVLSQHFFAKRWPRAELDGLFGLETTERKLILPIWKGVSEDEVRAFSPILAGYPGISTDHGMARVVNEIKRALALVDRYKGLQEAAWKEKFSSLDADWKHRNAANALARTTDGVQQATKVAHEIIAEARSRVEELKALEVVKLSVSDRFSGLFRTFVEGPRGIAMNVFFEAPVTNAVDCCKLRVLIQHRRGEIIREFEFLPKFDRELKVYWQGSDKTFATGGALLDFVFACFADLLSS